MPTTVPPSSPSAIPAANRSMPGVTVIPILHYPDVAAAAAWLCDAFGFTERLRIGAHRVQLDIACGAGAVVVAHRAGHDHAVDGPHACHSLMVRIHDIVRHYQQALSCGTRVLSPPANYPYGERQYAVADTGGHIWTFSQTIADVEPSAWGGQAAAPPRS